MSVRANQQMTTYLVWWYRPSPASDSAPVSTSPWPERVDAASPVDAIRALRAPDGATQCDVAEDRPDFDAWANAGSREVRIDLPLQEVAR